ncbi:MAG: hypothetical protein H7A51_15855 [Akkermansiaceae bacterium]|nr:hypothetical protein [Akkermansiaceae bacterium]
MLKSILSLAAASLITTTLSFAEAPSKLTVANFRESLRPKGFVLQEDEWHVWCNAPILDEQGKVHLFVARFPTSIAFSRGWHSAGEIAHYTAAKAEGPYTYLDTVLKADKSEGSWQKNGPHNVTVVRIPDGRYAMVYISNAGKEKHGAKFPANQKIGMLLADKLDGPWKPATPNGLVLDTPKSPDVWSHNSSVGVNNPTLLSMPDGRFFLYYKAIGADKPGLRRMGLAIADKVEGPYKFEKTALTDNVGTIEDGFAFHLNGKVNLLVTDCHGKGHGGGMIYQSDDGINFKTEPVRAYEAVDHYMPKWPNPARGWSPWVLQRPALLIGKNGIPTHLFAPCGTPPKGKKGTATFLLEIAPKN